MDNNSIIIRQKWSFWLDRNGPYRCALSKVWIPRESVGLCTFSWGFELPIRVWLGSHERQTTFGGCYEGTGKPSKWGIGTREWAKRNPRQAKYSTQYLFLLQSLCPGSFLSSRYVQTKLLLRDRIMNLYGADNAYNPYPFLTNTSFNLLWKSAWIVFRSSTVKLLLIQLSKIGQQMRIWVSPIFLRPSETASAFRKFLTSDWSLLWLLLISNAYSRSQ